MWTVRTGIVAVAVLTLSGFAWAQTPEVEPTALRVTDVAIFKHGYGFVMAEGLAKTKDGWALFSGVPQASLGTMWLYSPQAGVTVDRSVAQVQETKRRQVAENLDGLVLANIGATVTVVSSIGNSAGEVKNYIGTLLPPVMGDKSSQYGYGSPGQQRPTDEQLIWAAVPPRPDAAEKIIAYVMVKLENSEVAIPRMQVREVIVNGAAKREAEVVEPQQTLSARLVHAGKTVVGDTPVGMGYLAKGLRWIPSYRLEITGEGKGRLRLQGNIINDVADLKDSRVHLVVGVPHFVQEDVLSPLSLQVAWTRLSSYFAPIQQRDRDAYANAGYSQTGVWSGPRVADVVGQPVPMGMPGPAGQVIPGQAVSPVTGEAVEDLYFYQVPGLTLKRGSRASVAIFDEPVTYEDVYLWKVVDDKNYADSRWSPSYQQRNYNSGQRQTPEQEALARELANPKVWHALRMTNKGKAPWTTAPALVVRDWQPLAQSMMLFTPVGGSVDLTTTVAPDISTTRSVVEVGREKNSRQISGFNYDLLTVKGEMRLVSRKPQAARVIVTREFEGDVTQVTDGGQSSKLAESGGLNPNTRITWDFTLAPGAEKVLAYTYTVYVRL